MFLHELYFCESSERWRHRKEKIAIIKLVGVAFDMCGGNIDVEPNERYTWPFQEKQWQWMFPALCSITTVKVAE